MKYFKANLFIILIAAVFWPGTGSAGEIIIGFTGPLSGPAAEYGFDCLNGVDMAIKEVNAAGGITVKGEKYFFKLEKLDDRVDPKQTVANARRLRSNNALAIFNPVFGTMTGMMKINEEPGNEFLAMGYTSSPSATVTKNKLLVVNGPPLTLYVRVYADWAWDRKWRNAAMMVTSGAYGDEWRALFRNLWEKMGGRIVADQPANYYSRTDFTAPLKAVLTSNPDVILIGGPSGTTALVVEQARRLGYKGGIMLVEQAKLDYMAQSLEGYQMMENTIGTAAISSVNTPAMPAFEKKYKSMYRRLITWEVVLNYISMQALARAIAAADTVDDVYAIRAAFPKAFPMLGDQFPSETHGISPDGRINTMGAIQTVKNGKPLTADLYVWWAATRQEFNRIKKITKVGNPMKRARAKLDL